MTVQRMLLPETEHRIRESSRCLRHLPKTTRAPRVLPIADGMAVISANGNRGFGFDELDDGGWFGAVIHQITRTQSSS